jgi:hypothetical protein
MQNSSGMIASRGRCGKTKFSSDSRFASVAVEDLFPSHWLPGAELVWLIQVHLRCPVAPQLTTEPTLYDEIRSWKLTYTSRNIPSTALAAHNENLSFDTALLAVVHRHAGIIASRGRCGKKKFSTVEH